MVGLDIFKKAFDKQYAWNLPKNERLVQIVDNLISIDHGKEMAGEKEIQAVDALYLSLVKKIPSQVDLDIHHFDARPKYLHFNLHRGKKASARYRKELATWQQEGQHTTSRRFGQVAEESASIARYFFNQFGSGHSQNFTEAESRLGVDVAMSTLDLKSAKPRPKKGLVMFADSGVLVHHAKGLWFGQYTPEFTETLLEDHLRDFYKNGASSLGDRDATQKFNRRLIHTLNERIEKRLREVDKDLLSETERRLLLWEDVYGMPVSIRAQSSSDYRLQPNFTLAEAGTLETIMRELQPYTSRIERFSKSLVGTSYSGDLAEAKKIITRRNAHTRKLTSGTDLVSFYGRGGLDVKVDAAMLACIEDDSTKYMPMVINFFANSLWHSTLSEKETRQYMALCEKDTMPRKKEVSIFVAPNSMADLDRLHFMASFSAYHQDPSAVNEGIRSFYDGLFGR